MFHGVSHVVNSTEAFLSDSFRSQGFTYVPKYLYYMVLELLKNSARATIETSSSQEEIEARPFLWLHPRLRVVPFFSVGVCLFVPCLSQLFLQSSDLPPSVWIGLPKAVWHLTPGPV